MILATLVPAASPRPAPIRGPLQVHSDNPRDFADGSGRAVYSTGSHTWNNFQHNDVYPAVDFDKYQGPEIHTLDAPAAALDLQEAYVRRVVDTVSDLDNVLYEIGNEMHTESVPWQYRMIDFVHEYERGEPSQHPVGMTGAPIQNDALFASPADWISPASKDGYNADPPAADDWRRTRKEPNRRWPRGHL